MDLHCSNGMLQVRLILVETAMNDTRIEQNSQNNRLESQGPQSSDLCRSDFFSLAMEDAGDEMSCVPQEGELLQPARCLGTSSLRRVCNQCVLTVKGLARNRGGGRRQTNSQNGFGSSPGQTKGMSVKIPQGKVQSLQPLHFKGLLVSCPATWLHYHDAKRGVIWASQIKLLVFSGFLYLTLQCSCLPLSLSTHCFPPFPGFLLGTIFLNVSCAMSVIEKAKQNQRG